MNNRYSSIDTVLFDLDGTLLPMPSQSAFLRIYFGELAKICARLGLDVSLAMESLNKGIGLLLNNDGSRSGETCFWSYWESQIGTLTNEQKAAFDHFYSTDFNKAQAATSHNPLAAPIVHRLRQAGYTLVLASNPTFPKSAYRTRLSWTGLTLEDFDHSTSYEFYGHAKPHPAYYQDILTNIHKAPEQCLMVGNDVREDMVAATLGISTYLVTDNLLNLDEQDISCYPHGSFAEFCQWANEHLLQNTL